MLPGGSELLFIVLAVLLLFGGKELPRLARMMGQWSATMRRSLNEVRREFNRIGIQEEMERAAKSMKDELPSRESRPGTVPDPNRLRGGDTPPSRETLQSATPRPRPAEGAAPRSESVREFHGPPPPPPPPHQPRQPGDEPASSPGET